MNMCNQISYTLLMSAIEFKTLVLRDEVDAAFELLPSIPEDQHSSLARFLEARGLTKEALKVCLLSLWELRQRMETLLVEPELRLFKHHRAVRQSFLKQRMLQPC